MKKLTSPLLLVASLVGCGPSVIQLRTIVLPPRPADCDVQLLQLKAADYAAPAGAYEQLGSITLAEGGEQDPFQPSYTDAVRRRACAMGGEGMALLNQMTGSHGASGMFTRSVVNYVIVRKRPPTR